MSTLNAKIEAVWLIRHGATNPKEADSDECLSDTGFAEAASFVLVHATLVSKICILNFVMVVVQMFETGTALKDRSRFWPNLIHHRLRAYSFAGHCFNVMAMTLNILCIMAVLSWQRK